jgi:hypothetical protein
MLAKESKHVQMIKKYTRGYNDKSNNLLRFKYIMKIHDVLYS